MTIKGMEHDFQGIRGYDEGLELCSFSELVGEVVSRPLVYAGFLWKDALHQTSLDQTIHGKLVRAFGAGWSAVGFCLVGVSTVGPWQVPTTARPHRTAPLGCYLLSGERLRRTLETLSEPVDPLQIHLAQPALGSVFCDPGLELRVSSHDFHYRPPSRLFRSVGMLKQLLRGTP